MHILLDFVHVSEYIWDAAHCFHKPGTSAAEAWVVGRLTTILHGQATHTATEITAQADRTGLADRHRQDRRRLPPIVGDRKRRRCTEKRSRAVDLYLYLATAVFTLRMLIRRATPLYR